MPGKLVISAGLVALAVSVFWPVAQCGFTIFDDHVYVTDNPQVLRGVTWEGIRWALAATDQGNWHPLTWFSHMLDVELFGLRAGWHHLGNLFFHAAATVMLFLVLQSMTGAAWGSAAVAALFAVHPLHVESVAWIAERKDVLSACFWMLTMAGYLGYVRKPGRSRYLLALALFVLGLMSKPMLVTLPLVLLLLDFWPLGRFQGKTNSKGGPRSPFLGLLIEKIPFLALATASAVVTFIAQKRSGAVQPLMVVPLDSRIGNSIHNYLWYLGKLGWPSDLAALYLYPSTSPPWPVTAAALTILGGACILVFRQAAKTPYLLTGWLWYLGTLVPVIGLVQVGIQARADRYMYIPSIGLLIIAVFKTAEFIRGSARLRNATAVAMALLVLGYAVAAHQQVGHWRSTVTLFTRAVQTTERNWMAYYILGLALNKEGRKDEAVRAYAGAIDANPNFPDAYFSLGLLYLDRRDWGGALAQYESLLRVDPQRAEKLGRFIDYASGGAFR